MEIDESKIIEDVNDGMAIVTEHAVKAIENTICFGNKCYYLGPQRWVTVNYYRDKYRLRDTHIIMKWIKKGIIPEGDWVRIPHLNNICLIRDRFYIQNPSR